MHPQPYGEGGLGCAVESGVEGAGAMDGTAGGRSIAR